MRKSVAETPVSARPLTIPIAPVNAIRIVCAAMGLALVLLVVRIVGQL